jgi:hypothetical protein
MLAPNSARKMSVSSAGCPTEPEPTAPYEYKTSSILKETCDKSMTSWKATGREQLRS